MQNIKLTLQYDGTRYLGWKRPEKATMIAQYLIKLKMY